MRYDEVRELLVRQWTYTGGPNEAKGSELYHDDAVLEFPQSGERFVGRANIDGWRQQYPARLDFEPRELRGAGDLWVAETGLRYDGGELLSVIKILQFRGDKVERETLYFAEPFAAPSGAGRGPTTASRSAAATSRPTSAPEAEPGGPASPGPLLGMVGAWPTRMCSPWSSPAARGSGWRR